MNEEDREFILDILNYEFTDILKSLGFNTDGGKFVFAKKEGNTLSQHIDIVTKLNAMGLPMDDDYLYETFAVRKPANYDEIKKAKEEQKKALKLAFSAVALEMKDVQGGGIRLDGPCRHSHWINPYSHFHLYFSVTSNLEAII